MDSQQIFITYLKVKAEFEGRPWKYPKNWDKIRERKDWAVFERLAISSLINPEDFFRANFEARGGRFGPHQFFHKNSITFYNRWKKLPKLKPDINRMCDSLRFIIDFCRISKTDLREYFYDTGVYPKLIQHLEMGKLHRWIFTYYVRKVNQMYMSEIPWDIIEHALSKSKEDVEAAIDIWWIQLINENKAQEILKAFFERFL